MAEEFGVLFNAVVTGLDRTVLGAAGLRLDGSWLFAKQTRAME